MSIDNDNKSVLTDEMIRFDSFHYFKTTFITKSLNHICPFCVLFAYMLYL